MSEMPYDQLLLWKDFYDVDPFGPSRVQEDIAYAIMKLTASLPLGQRTLRLSDFVLERGRGRGGGAERGNGRGRDKVRVSNDHPIGQSQWNDIMKSARAFAEAR